MMFGRSILTVVMIGALAGLGMPRQSVAQTISIVGSAHLHQLDGAPSAAQLSHAVDALARFEPTAVCVELMSGERGERLLENPEEFGGLLQRTARVTLTIGSAQERTLGTRPAAARRSADALVRRWNELAIEDRARLIALQLAGSELPSVALNWSSAIADCSLGNLDQWARPSWIAMYCPYGRSAAPGSDGFMEVVDRRRRSAPHTYGRVLMGIVCGAWRVPIANPPSPLPGDRLPAFLGAGTTDNDIAGTEQLLAHVPGSVTIAVEGAGHVVYLPGLGPANRCVLDHLSRYLIELALPSPGTRCAAEGAEDAEA